MKISIAVSKLLTASHGDNVSHSDKAIVDGILPKTGGTTVSVDATTLPPSIIDNLLKEKLSASQARVLGLVLHGVSKDTDALFSAVVSSPSELHGALAGLWADGAPNVEVFINDRWYPTAIQSNLSTLWGGGGKQCSFSATMQIADFLYPVNVNIYDHEFLDDQDQVVPIRVRDLLVKYGFRQIESDIKDHFENLQLADKLQARCGHPMIVIGKVLMREERSWFRGVDSVELGTPVAPAYVVVEGEMEGQGQSDSHGSVFRLPFVRIFSLERKRYAYVDVRDLHQRNWDEHALDKLTLNNELYNILRTVFNVPTDQLFGDIVAGKAGGMIVLAEGGPGVGKTMTAEVFAEHTKRPLYVLEMAELGTTLSSVEDNLRRVFRRAARWNAVLLFDEADIFMSKRGENLERSAIVGVFLRLMDYYKGMLFLTTNRSDVLDPAFKSRITLALKYPPLDAESRLKIWMTMFDSAGVKLVDESGQEINWETLPACDQSLSFKDVELNGRQIRNMVRLIKVIYNSQVTPRQVTEVCKFVAK